MAQIEAIVGEFEAELEELADRCVGAPEEEVRHLWQVALERESLVAVAYRRDIIGSRLSRMPVPEDARQVVARAIRWAWRDEEMHALWIRGVLLREGTRADRLRAWQWMVEGRIAGWTSSRQAHYRWAEAPMKRAVAEALELGGRLSGRIPASVGAELQFRSFRDYCHFNIAAERTAELAWRRMAELARDPAAGVHPEDADAFARIADDEVRHGQLFTLLNRSFDDEDRLVPGMDARALTESVAAIGQRFLASPSPGDDAWQNPLGKGAPVVVREGDVQADVLDAVLAAIGPLPVDQHVVVKTTFMFGVRREDRSPMVSSALLGHLARRLVENGCRVTVLEAGNIYDRFHEGRDVAGVARAFGFEQADYAVLDAQDEQEDHAYLRGFGVGTASRVWRDADVRIVVGKLRSHPSQAMFGSLDVMEGLAGRHDAFTFSDRKADRHTALLALADALPPDLAILDAWGDVPDGLTGMMGCENPLQPRRLYASTDAVSLDAVLTRHVGVDPERTLLGAAFDWFGDPRERLTIDGLDAPLATWRGPDATLASSVLSAMALPMWDHASGRGALFIPDMDPELFPPLQSAGPVFAAARTTARRLLTVGARRSADVGLLATTFVDVLGAQIRVHRSGEGPVVVLLHGYPDTLQLFSRLVPALSGYTVVTFDWPGQGHSTPLNDVPTPHTRVHHLMAILDALGIYRAHLVATDMGAHPALVAARLHPERVDRVVVMNALLYGEGPTSVDIAVMRRSGLNRAAFRYTPGRVWRRCLDTFMEGDLPAIHHDDLWGALQQGSVREELIRLCDATEAAFPTLPDLYRAVSRPVLAVWGANDTHFPVEQGRRLCAEVTSGRLVVVEKAGHWMVWSHAEQVAAQIRGFTEET